MTDERIVWLRGAMDHVRRATDAARGEGAWLQSLVFAQAEVDLRTLAKHTPIHVLVGQPLSACNGVEIAGTSRVVPRCLCYWWWPCDEVRNLLAVYRFVPVPGFREEWTA